MPFDKDLKLFEGWIDAMQFDDCPGRPGRLSALSVFLSKSGLYGAFVRARRALKHQKRWFPAGAVVAEHAVQKAALDARSEPAAAPLAVAHL